MAQTTMVFSKSLTDTDINRRLAIPTKILPSLPDFNISSHKVKIHLLYRSKMWPIVCSIRRRGRYKKPVFSGGWRNFVICNNFNVGDKLTLYKVQDEAESFHYKVDVEKPAGDLSGPRPARSLNHDDNEVDETPGTSRTKVCNNYEVDVEEQLPKADADAPIKLEGVIMEHTDVAADHVISKPADHGDKLTLYKVQDEAEFFHYNVDVEKPAGDLSGPPPARSLNHDDHEVDETPGTSRTKVCNNYEVDVEEQLPKADADAPIKLEGIIMEHTDVAADHGFVDHVISKPGDIIFGTNLSDEATSSKAHFIKNEHETEMKFLELTTSGIGKGESPPNSDYITQEDHREIKFFDLMTKYSHGATAAPYGTSRASEACYQSTNTDILDLVLGESSTPYTGSLNLNLTLGPLTVDGGLEEEPVFSKRTP